MFTPGQTSYEIVYQDKHQERMERERRKELKAEVRKNE